MPTDKNSGLKPPPEPTDYEVGCGKPHRRRRGAQQGNSCITSSTAVECGATVWLSSMELALLALALFLQVI